MITRAMIGQNFEIIRADEVKRGDRVIVQGWDNSEIDTVTNVSFVGDDVEVFTERTTGFMTSIGNPVAVVR